MQPLVEDTDELIYQLDSVTISYQGKTEIPQLEFSVGDATFLRALAPGGPKSLVTIAVPSGSPVRFWYDRVMHAWVVVHTHNTTPERSTSTIFLPDSGVPYVRNGDTTSAVPYEPPKVTSLLRAVGLVLIIFLSSANI